MLSNFPTVSFPVGDLCVYSAKNEAWLRLVRRDIGVALGDRTGDGEGSVAPALQLRWGIICRRSRGAARVPPPRKS